MQPLGQHMIIEHRKKQGSYDISLIPNQEKKSKFYCWRIRRREKSHLFKQDGSLPH